MQQKSHDKPCATADLKRLAIMLVDKRLSDDARKLVVIAIASEPVGVSKLGELATAVPTPANEKALDLLEARDMSHVSLEALKEVVNKMPMGHRARNHAEIQTRRLSLTAKYIRVHADDFFYENETPVRVPEEAEEVEPPRPG